MTVNFKEIAMVPHRPWLRWRRGDPVFHGLNLEAFSAVVEGGELAVSTFNGVRSTASGYSWVHLILTGPGRGASEKYGISLAGPRPWPESGGIALEQIWIEGLPLILQAID